MVAARLEQGLQSNDWRLFQEWIAPKVYVEMNWKDRIVLDPKILVGKPVVKGTRLVVDFVIDLLAQGWAEADIVKNYPALTREDIQACLAYASAALRDEKVYTLKS